MINTAARNNLAVKQYGETLDSSLQELGSQLVALWVINRQRDSLELLREFIDAVPKAAVHVVRNGYFGDEKKSSSTTDPRSARRWRAAGASRLRSPIWPIASPMTST